MNEDLIDVSPGRRRKIREREIETVFKPYSHFERIGSRMTQKRSSVLSKLFLPESEMKFQDEKHEDSEDLDIDVEFSDVKMFEDMHVTKDSNKIVSGSFLNMN